MSFLKQSVSPSTSQVLTNPVIPWFNVRHPDYGAVGNGDADDTSAISSAINAAIASPYGGKIYFPKGIYRITGSLPLITRSGVFLVGDGIECSTIKMDGNPSLRSPLSINDPENLDAFFVFDNNLGASVPRPFGHTVMELSFECTNNVTKGSIFHIDFAWDFTFDKIKIVNPYNIIYGRQLGNLRIRNFIATNVRGAFGLKVFDNFQLTRKGSGENDRTDIVSLSHVYMSGNFTQKANTTASISGTTLTVTGPTTGTIATGQFLRAENPHLAQISLGTQITGGSGNTWTINNSQTIGSNNITFWSGNTPDLIVFDGFVATLIMYDVFLENAGRGIFLDNTPNVSEPPSFLYTFGVKIRNTKESCLHSNFLWDGTLAGFSASGSLASYGVYLANSCQRIAFSSASFQKNRFHGIFIDRNTVTDTEFVNCTFSENGESGIYCGPGDGITVTGGLIANNGRYGIDTSTATRVTTSSIRFENNSLGNFFVPPATSTNLLESIPLPADSNKGFFMVSSMAGIPTGDPSFATGMASMVVDTTNNRLYVRAPGGVWRYVALI